METVAENNEDAKNTEDPIPAEVEKEVKETKLDAQDPVSAPPIAEDEYKVIKTDSNILPVNTQSPPSSPRVQISLKSPESKPSNLHLEIAESLLDRKQQIEAKIRKMRVQKNANEIKQLQNMPKINKKSKILASNSPSAMLSKDSKSRTSGKADSEKISDNSFLQLIPDNPNSQNQSKKKDHSVFDNSELIKSSVKLRENLSEKKEKPEFKKLSLTARNEITKQKKINKIKDAEQEKKIKELEGCTFKPKILNSKTETEDCDALNKVNSGNALRNEGSPRANRTVLEFFDSFQLTEAKTFGCEYAQVSPVDYHLRHKHGFNVGKIVAKAKPMVDYRMVAANLLG